MGALVLGIIVFLILATLFIGAIYLVLWWLGQMGIALPPMLINVMWVLVVLILLYFAVTIVLGGGNLPFRLGGRSDLSPVASTRLASTPTAAGRHLSLPLLRG